MARSTLARCRAIVAVPLRNVTSGRCRTHQVNAHGPAPSTSAILVCCRPAFESPATGPAAAVSHPAPAEAGSQASISRSSFRAGKSPRLNGVAISRTSPPGAAVSASNGERRARRTASNTLPYAGESAWRAPLMRTSSSGSFQRRIGNCCRSLSSMSSICRRTKANHGILFNVPVLYGTSFIVSVPAIQCFSIKKAYPFFICSIHFFI